MVKLMELYRDSVIRCKVGKPKNSRQRLVRRLRSTAVLETGARALKGINKKAGEDRSIIAYRKEVFREGESA
jgi:hypothetical protein